MRRRRRELGRATTVRLRLGPVSGSALQAGSPRVCTRRAGAVPACPASRRNVPYFSCGEDTCTRRSRSTSRGRVLCRSDADLPTALPGARNAAASETRKDPMLRARVASTDELVEAIQVKLADGQPAGPYLCEYCRVRGPRLRPLPDGPEYPALRLASRHRPPTGLRTAHTPAIASTPHDPGGDDGRRSGRRSGAQRTGVDPRDRVTGPGRAMRRRVGAPR